MQKYLRKIYDSQGREVRQCVACGEPYHRNHKCDSASARARDAAGKRDQATIREPLFGEKLEYAEEMCNPSAGEQDDDDDDLGQTTIDPLLPPAPPIEPADRPQIVCPKPRCRLKARKRMEHDRRLQR